MKMLKLATIAMAAVTFAGVSESLTANAMTTYNQKAAANNGPTNAKTITNTNAFKQVPKTYAYGKNSYGSTPNYMNVNAGAKNVKFKTYSFLQNWSAQSVAFVGHYAYVLNNHNQSAVDNDLKDFVIRYDLSKINGYQIPSDAVKVGPVFEGGHGQSLSYNPKTK